MCKTKQNKAGSEQHNIHSYLSVCINSYIHNIHIYISLYTMNILLKSWLCTFKNWCTNPHEVLKECFSEFLTLWYGNITCKYYKPCDSVQRENFLTNKLCSIPYLFIVLYNTVHHKDLINFPWHLLSLKSKQIVINNKRRVESEI